MARIFRFRYGVKGGPIYVNCRIDKSCLDRVLQKVFETDLVLNQLVRKAFREQMTDPLRAGFILSDVENSWLAHRVKDGTVTAPAHARQVWESVGFRFRK